MSSAEQFRWVIAKYIESHVIKAGRMKFDPDRGEEQISRRQGRSRDEKLIEYGKFIALVGLADEFDLWER